ncbi:MAG: hypothetical protein H6747_03820 [Deltaproteobacteria bacterium]|nr:hypothetical protein [Deltaproteobacteria bacterium]
MSNGQQNPGRHAQRLTLIAWALAGAVALVGCGEATGEGGSSGATDAAGAADDSAAVGDSAAGSDAGATDTGSDGSGADAAATDASGSGDAGGGPMKIGETIDLGKATIDPQTGYSGALSVEIPAGTVSFAITLIGEKATTYAIDDLKDPTGETLVLKNWGVSDITGGQMCLSCKVRVAPQKGASAALVPNAPGVDVVAGTYTFRVNAFTSTQQGAFSQPKKEPAGGDVAVVVALQKAAAKPKKGRLDINLWYTGANDLSVEKGPTDPRVVQWIARLRTLYEQIGVEIGEVRHFPISADFEVADVTSNDGGDFAAIGAATAGAPAGVNFIFVREISSPFGGFGAVLGVSGGIPGPVGMQGAPRNAVVVSTSDIPGGFGRPAKEHDVGATMAHEGGHYLGLFHTSENDFGGFGPKLHDPLPDTPEKDTTNLMYFDGGSGGSGLSPQQGDVVRGNPWVVPVEEK